MKTKALARSTASALVLASIGTAFFWGTTALGETSFAPDEPTTDDTITLTVKRTFEADCAWQVEPDVQRDNGEIVVALELSGAENCEGVITDLAVEIEIGRLPEGANEVKICWSDGRMSEATHITVRPAISVK